MRVATLVRTRSSDQGTFGTLYLDDGGRYCTAEPPQRDNRRGVSCIPAGKYACTYLPRSASGKYRAVYHVREVPGRGGILIHNGNLAGDASKGYQTHSQGCILIGKQRGALQGQEAVLASKPALRELTGRLKEAPLELWIIDLTRR